MKKAPAKMKKKSMAKAKMPMTTVNGKKVPAFAADGKGANDMKSSAKMKKAAMKMKKAPMKVTAAQKKKFKVYPSAYANMWASGQQKKGKC